ncbi:MAG TPA: HD domain-containing protein, partial [Acidobacteriota bacterium]
MQETLRDKPEWRSQNLLIVEVGGGSTDISLMQSGHTLHSGSFPLGSVRMRQNLIAMKADIKQRMRILDRQIKNTIDTISNTIPLDQTQEIIALGGDIRFAAKQLLTDIPSIETNKQEDFSAVGTKDFAKFCNEIVKLDAEELVRRFQLPYAQAEALAPALLAYKNIFERTKAERFRVLAVTIRDGLLLDMSRREFGKRIESLEEQILASTLALARKYRSNENHIEQVRRLSLELFDQLQSEHGLQAKERLLLEIAALLHDVGQFISDRSHHKHTQYIIAASEIFGLSREDIELVSNIARYHRKSPPVRTHLSYVSLDRESRMIVSKLAAL